MRFASLGSGSRGNSLVVASGGTKLLLDCGFSTRSTLERLARLAILPEEIAGILVTHEHSDHVAGVFRFANRFRVPVYLTQGTFSAIRQADQPVPVCHFIDGGSSFAIEDLEITPFAVPHDAREAVQYVFSTGSRRLGVLTDCGKITPHIVNVLGVCDALVVECNHDQDMLSASSYPANLKRRISGGYGHLANTQAANLLSLIETEKLQHIVAAHLSEQNNRPELAVRALSMALDCAEEWIGVAFQKEGFAWRQVF